MPIQREVPKKHPWIAFIGVSLVAHPTRMSHFASWSTGSVVGPRHILTAAHVCKLLDVERRQWVATLGTRGCRLVCIPGFHWPSDLSVQPKPLEANTKIYPIASDAFRVSKHSLFTNCRFTNLKHYKRSIGKILHQNFYDHDVGMYFLDQDLPASLTRADLRHATDAQLAPEGKRPMLAHGYPYEQKSRSGKKGGHLMFANTYPVRTWPAHFALHDAPLGPGASGGPVWIHKTKTPPRIIGLVSGFKTINFGGPVVGWDPSLGGDGNFIEDPKTGKRIPLRTLEKRPRDPKWIRCGVASRLTRETYLEIKRWLQKRR